MVLPHVSSPQIRQWACRMWDLSRPTRLLPLLQCSSKALNGYSGSDMRGVFPLRRETKELLIGHSRIMTG